MVCLSLRSQFARNHLCVYLDNVSQKQVHLLRDMWQLIGRPNNPPPNDEDETEYVVSKHTDDVSQWQVVVEGEHEDSLILVCAVEGNRLLHPSLKQIYKITIVILVKTQKVFDVVHASHAIRAFLPTNKTKIHITTFRTITETW